MPSNHALPQSAVMAVARSLWTADQRRELVGFARSVGAKALFLKAAWADPVLYGGKGERAGGDIDVLVESPTFAAFCRELVAHGYRRGFVETHPATAELAKEWTLIPPNGGLVIDVHRALADAPWFRFPVEEAFARAIEYPSVDGRILSLCPDDQVLYCAAHYGNHNLGIDDKHLQDVVRLLAKYPVDWGDIWMRAKRYRLDAVLTWVCRRLSEFRRLNEFPRLSELGAETMATGSGRPGAWSRTRLQVAERIVAAVEPRRRQLRTARDALSLAALSGRPSALPRFLGRYAYLRTLDLARRVWSGVVDW